MILHRAFRRLLSSAALIAVTSALALGYGTVEAQVLDDVVDAIVEGQVQQQMEDALTQQLSEALAEQLNETIARHLDATLAEALELIDEVEPDDRSFVSAIDDDGATIESNVWVILARPEQVAWIEEQGYRVIEKRRLPALGRALLRVEAPADRELAEAVLQLELQAPGTTVDVNHVYRTQSVTPAKAAGRSRRTTGKSPPAEDLVVGIVDTRVATDHPALRDARVVQHDIVPYDRPRPEDHGTAVASILVGNAPELQGRLPGATLYAATVFFEDVSGNSASTAASLVQALDWLASSGVRVVNMSLSGPPNQLLRAAVEQLSAAGVVVVAAVGNDGPAVTPRFPAAYPSVIGVTAVDTTQQVFRYANRGAEVTFAAPGVNVRVAMSNGSIGTDSGTSMAAPVAASIILKRWSTLLGSAGGKPSVDRLLNELRQATLDLGEPGFDEVFGYGLIRDPQTR